MSRALSLLCLAAGLTLSPLPQAHAQPAPGETGNNGLTALGNGIGESGNTGLTALANGIGEAGKYSVTPLAKGNGETGLDSPLARVPGETGGAGPLASELGEAGTPTWSALATPPAPGEAGDTLATLLKEQTGEAGTVIQAMVPGQAAKVANPSLRLGTPGETGPLPPKL